MLQYCGKSEECLGVLEGYVQKNPDNPNGLKLLHKHHKDTKADPKVLIDNLQVCRQLVEFFRLHQKSGIIYNMFRYKSN